MQLTVVYDRGHRLESCPAIAALEGYVFGRLSPDECETVEDHCLICRICDEWLEQERELRAAFWVVFNDTGQFAQDDPDSTLLLSAEVNATLQPMPPGRETR